MTAGHSNRPAAEFVEMLKTHGARLLVDVRTMPRSRHNPQFNREVLPGTLAESAIDYLHFPALGGLRHARPDSTNTGWLNPNFRGFADYMQTVPFEAALAELMRLGDTRPTAIMCAEAVPWRCHRSLIADALVARGVPVLHLLSAQKSYPHELTPFARVERGRVDYPGLL
jgi:uncharacterized protein (DUF488 family)